MIYASPQTWQELQERVCSVLNQIGFKATTNEPVETPRGVVNIDVYAIDPFSIDKLIYITECKNWESNVPQAVIHSFTTVMQETGANVGYIISKAGFQKGAYDYIQNTSIKNFTFGEFQEKYLRLWIEKYFNTTILQACDSLIQYTEPINSRRERFVSALSMHDKEKFIALKNKYSTFGTILTIVTSTSSEVKGLNEIEAFKESLSKHSGIVFQSTCYSDLLKEIRETIEQITNQFNDLFGKDIFQEITI